MTMFICGSRWLTRKASYQCQYCTDRGIPGGYTDREEWALDRLANGWTQVECPSCHRWNFKDMFKKPHGHCTLEVNAVRMALIASAAAPTATASTGKGGRNEGDTV